MVRKEINKYTILALFVYYLKVVHFCFSLNDNLIISIKKSLEVEVIEVLLLVMIFYLLSTSI